jgi:hypothetical protein
MQTSLTVSPASIDALDILLDAGWVVKFVVPFHPAYGGATISITDGRILVILEKNS